MTDTQRERRLREALNRARDEIDRARQEERKRCEQRREWPDDFHVRDGKQLGLFQALQILDRHLSATNPTTGEAASNAD